MILVKNNVYVKEKAEGITLASFLDINKLYAEYHAIEHVLVKLHRYEKPEGIEIDMQMERLQKLKQQSSWLGEDR